MLVCNYKLSYPRANPAALRRDPVGHSQSSDTHLAWKVGNRRSAITAPPFSTCDPQRALETGRDAIRNSGVHRRRRAAVGFPNDSAHEYEKFTSQSNICVKPRVRRYDTRR